MLIFTLALGELVQHTATKRKPWTELGWLRKEAEVAARQKELHEAVAALAAARGVSNSVSSDNGDFAPLMGAHSRAELAHMLASDELSRIYKVEPPREAKHGQVCVLVTVMHLDPVYADLRGETETFLLGGPGELDVNDAVRVYPCDHGIGKAVVMAEVGDIVTAETERGTTFNMEVTALAVPDIASLLQKLQELEAKKAA